MSAPKIQATKAILVEARNNLADVVKDAGDSTFNSPATLTLGLMDYMISLADAFAAASETVPVPPDRSDAADELISRMLETIWGYVFDLNSAWAVAMLAAVDPGALAEIQPQETLTPEEEEARLLAAVDAAAAKQKKDLPN